MAEIKKSNKLQRWGLLDQCSTFVATSHLVWLACIQTNDAGILEPQRTWRSSYSFSHFENWICSISQYGGVVKDPGGQSEWYMLYTAAFISHPPSFNIFTYITKVYLDVLCNKANRLVFQLPYLLKKIRGKSFSVSIKALHDTNCIDSVILKSNILLDLMGKHHSQTEKERSCFHSGYTS